MKNRNTIDERNLFINFKRQIAQAILIVYDIVIIAVATFFSLLLRFEDMPIMDVLHLTVTYTPIFCILFIGLFLVFRIYHSLWRYSGFNEVIKIFHCVFIGMITALILNELTSFGASRSVIILTGMLFGIFAGTTRFGYRFYRRIHNMRYRTAGKAPLLVVGAGYSGAYIVSQVQTGRAMGNYHSMLLVDDDPLKQGMHLQGVPVAGKVKDIPDIVKKNFITDIVIAIPSLSQERFTEIFEICSATGCRVRMIPLLQDADDHKISPVRDVNISDILFRNEVDLDKESIGAYLSGKRVMVTGGGGSIGSELCRQAARFGAEMIVVYDIYENSAYELLCEMKDHFGDHYKINIAIGSIRDKKRLEMVIQQYRPHIILHAAAHKHVPLMEDAPGEAIKNNVLGTLNVLEVANMYGVDRFVQISTDKAVNPTNVMGASKRVAELIVQSFARKTQMKCMTVRFGNVLGSHGSVIPLMERQIKNGGPVRVTHPDITRYFMTIPEATQLVLQAGALAESGAIYVLDMKTPIKIMDLAEKLIRLYGYVPNVDMPIVITGLRKGEKLYEELVMEEEQSTITGTEHCRIFKVQTTNVDMDWLDAQIPRLLNAAYNSDYYALQVLKSILPNFSPRDEAGEESIEEGESAAVNMRAT